MKKTLATLAFIAGIAGTAYAETTIKLGHFGPGTDVFSLSVEAFAEEVNERSEGRLNVQVYPAGQLGNERQQISALQGGLQEILVTASTNVTNMHPPLSLLDLPFAFGNEVEADAVTMGDFSEKLLDGLDASGLVGLALWENGFRVISNNVHPISTPADLEGIKMRVLGAPVFIDTFGALGSSPVPMPFTELYSALETGTVDGQDNTFVTVDMMKFYEVQKHLTLTNHMYSAFIVLAGKPFMDRLTPEDRAVLEEVSAEFGAKQRKQMRDASAPILEFLSGDAGMEVIKSLTPEQLAEFRSAVVSVVDATVTDDLRPLYDEMTARINAASN